MKYVIPLAAVLTIASPAFAARKAHPHALPPVPQSADIARLNRESLAKIRPATTPPPAPATTPR